MKKKSRKTYDKKSNKQIKELPNVCRKLFVYDPELFLKK